MPGNNFQHQILTNNFAGGKFNLIREKKEFKLKCFYHTDMDGKCSAAVVHRRYHEETNVEYIPMNYAMDFPFDDIRPNEAVIIVDFSLEKAGDFEKLLNITKNVIWIDHHKSAIEKNAKFADVIDGVRESGVAGCELTWKFFFPEIEIPDIIKYLADYDLWLFEFGDSTKRLQAGIRLWNTHPAAKNWTLWFEDPITIEEIFDAGKIALDLNGRNDSSYIKAHSFRTEFEGHKAIVCNIGSKNSSVFDSVKDRDFSLMITFVFNGEKWTVTIFAEDEEIDCSELAKLHGGGGHKGAAGFVCTEQPFKK